MPDLPLTIPQVVARAVERFGDREAVVDGDVRLSFVEFADEIDRAARALIATGVEPGDRVAIWAPNMYEWAVAALGVHRIGGVVIPLNTRFKGKEAGYVIGAARRSLPVHGDRLPRHRLRRAAARRAAARSRSRRRSCCAARSPRARRRGPTSWPAPRPSIPPKSAARARRDPAGRPLRHPLHVSGTTGAPKGAMLFHSASIRAFDSWSDIVGLREGDRYLVINPFFHTFGLKAGILAGLLKGATLVPHPIFDVPSVMRRVAEERITMLPGPPADLPDDPQPSAISTTTTCRRCGCRSPARRRSRRR